MTEDMDFVAPNFGVVGGKNEYVFNITLTPCLTLRYKKKKANNKETVKNTILIYTQIKCYECCKSYFSFLLILLIFWDVVLIYLKPPSYKVKGVEIPSKHFTDMGKSLINT